MKKSVLLFTLLLGFVLSTIETKAQQRPVNNKGKLEYSGLFDTYYTRGPINLTLGAGLFKYGGTLNDVFSSNFTYGVSLGANYKVWPRCYVGGDITYLTLGSKDMDSKRNYSFTGWGLEIAPHFRFNLIDDIILRHQEKSSEPRFFKPYVLVGVAALYYKATATGAPTDSATAINYPAGTFTNKSPITLAIPAGLGGSFYISPKFSLLAEVLYRYTLSDILDAAVSNPKTGNDGYLSVNLKLQFTPEAKAKKKKPSFDGYLAPLTPEQKAKIDSANKAKRELLEKQIARQKFIEDSTRIADSTQQANESAAELKRQEEELLKQQQEEERLRKEAEQKNNGGKKKGKKSSGDSWGGQQAPAKKEDSFGW